MRLYRVAMNARGRDQFVYYGDHLHSDGVGIDVYTVVCYSGAIVSSYHCLF
jgi:hypothetical protein